MLQTLLQKRSNGYYYFRWVCPPAIRKLLGKREIIKSLRTDSKIEALARAGHLYSLVNRLKAQHERSLIGVQSVEFELFKLGYNGVVVEDLRARVVAVQAVMNDYLEIPATRKLLKKAGRDELVGFDPAFIEELNQSELMALNESQQRLAKIIFSEHLPWLMAVLLHFSKNTQAATYRELQYKRESIPKVLKFYRDAKKNRLGEVFDGVTIYQVLDGLFLNEPKFKLLKPMSSVLKFFPEIYQRYLEVMTDTSHQMLMLQQTNLSAESADDEITQLFQVAASKKAKQASPSETKPPVSSIKLSALFEEFLAYKIAIEDLSKDSQKDHRTNFPVLLHFIGDLPIADITSRKVKACLQACLKFPKRILKPYKGKSVAEIAALDIPENHRLSPKSVENYKKLLQGIFAYAKEQEYIQQSPAVDLNLGIKVSKVKAAFSNSEVRALLRAANALDGKYEERKWIVLLGGYTGARLGEITQLRREDFKVDPDSGIKYLRITSEAGSVKTDNANRLVPIHSKLLELGFKVFADGVGDDGRLFPNHFGKSKRITTWFPSFVSKLGISKLNDLNQSRTFHSFRHSFITEARGASQSVDLVQAIVGHERTSAGLTDAYTGHFTVDKLQPVVESIVYL